MGDIKIAEGFVVETKLMGDDDDMEKTARLSTSAGHWNGVRTVWVFDQIGDMCDHNGESWVWKRVGVCPRH